MSSIFRRVNTRINGLKFILNKNCLKFKCYHEGRYLLKVSYPVNLNVSRSVKWTSEFSCSVLTNRDKSCFNCFSTVAKENVNEIVAPDAQQGKIFFELENEEFHNYLENNPNYAKTIHKRTTSINVPDVSEEEFNVVIKKQCWDHETVDEYFADFVNAAKFSVQNCTTISNPIFTSLCNAFPSKCFQFSDDQLVKIFICLHNWPQAPSVKDENFVKVWKSLDAICVQRRTKWGYKKLLYMIDLWYSLKLTRLSLFVFKGIDKCIFKGRRLTEHQLVQVMFYLNTIRKVPHKGSIYELEYQLSRIIDKLTIEEIGIVCSGFFKSQSKINSKDFVDDIMEKLMEHYPVVDRITFTSILKLIRYSMKHNNQTTLVKMLDKFSCDMHKNLLQVNMHLALTTVTQLLSHPQTINNLAEQFLLSPQSARLKDMEKIASLISLFNISNATTDKTCQLIISELEKQERHAEFTLYGTSLVRCLCSLSFKNYFSEKLTLYVLDEEFIKSQYASKYVMSRELLQLDQNVAVEFLDYNGPRLPVETRNFLSKKYSTPIPGSFETKGPAFERMMRDLMGAVRAFCNDNDDFWHCAYLLPHFSKADILLCLDENNKPLVIPKEIKNVEPFTGCIKPTNTSAKWCALLMGAKMHTSSDLRPTGEQVCKIRQLKLFGYTPIDIPYYDWMQYDTEAKRIDYLKGRLNSTV